MTSHEALRQHILEALTTNPTGTLLCKTSQLSLKFDLQEKYVRRFLVDMCKQKLISMATWDNYLRDEVEFKNWPSKRAFWNNRDDGGYVRIRVQSVEGKFSAEIPKQQQVGLS
jgi:hypothetical protein